MDFQTALGFTLPIGVGIAAIGSALGLGRAVGSAMEAMGRQPEAAGKIQTAMVIGAAFINFNHLCPVDSSDTSGKIGG